MKLSDLPPHLRTQFEVRAAVSKYKVGPKDTRTADGIVFDSKAEMHRYRELVAMKARGIVSYFLRQVPFHLPGGVKYICDFMVVYPYNRGVEFEDVKGMRTQVYRIKQKQVEALYPIKIREVK